MGACRVKYLLQSLPPSAFLSEVVEQCETGLRRGLLRTLGCTSISSTAWDQALIPVRLGGLGLRSPRTVQKAARLAALVNIRERALELGAHPEHLRLDFEAAMDEMATELKVEYLPELQAGKKL